MEFQLGRWSIRKANHSTNHNHVPYTPEYLATEPPTNKICRLLFEKAIGFHFAYPERQLIGEVRDEKGVALEYIALASDIDGMSLVRPGPDRIDSASFPYFLSETVVGFDLNTSLPCDVVQMYLIDRQGNFHKHLEQYEKQIATLTDDHLRVRLLRFLKDCKLVEMRTADSQQPHM